PAGVLGVEAAASVVAASPRARIGVAVSSASDAAAFGRADVVRRAEAGAPWDELAAALPALAPGGGS
ncbi:MAG TPA: hypothetical protein VHJ20_04975, partial [Polyangia bacterium]|nr:hypothetical protein [Polyangia bacterium]